MLFTSYEFIGFAAVLLLAYYIIPPRFQGMILLGFSCFFIYAADPACFLYLGATIVTTYFAACRMDRHPDKPPAELGLNREEKKAYKKEQKKIRKKWMLACLFFNLGILASVKYLNFILENIRVVLSPVGVDMLEQPFFVSLALPLGISFYTFQSMGYLIDVYRGTQKAEKNIFRFALFVSFFPQLIQGPVSRFGELTETLYARHRFDAKIVCYGLQRVLWGFFKKLVIADRIAAAVGAITGDVGTYHGAYAFAGMIFYTLQLYADFTGGIDITIGIAEALGIKVRENFCRPYFSKSLKEYWRRWHISMGSWFRDYMFYPLSSSRRMLDFSKTARKYLGDYAGKRIPVHLSSLAVWFATGIWHGASWNFIIWGLANWAVLMISQELEPLYLRFHQRFPVKRHFGYKLFQVGRTFLLVCCLHLFDCYGSVRDTLGAFGSMFAAGNWEILVNGGLLSLGLTMLDYQLLAVGAVMLLAVSLVQRRGKVRDQIMAKPYPVRFALWFGLFLATLLAGAYGVGYDSSQFIYNRF